MSKDNQTTNQNAGKTPHHTAAGRFAPGNRASPGRPPRRGAAAEMRDALAGDLTSIIDKVRQQALDGCQQSQRLIIDRLVPALRPVEQPLEQPVHMPTDATLAQQAASIVEAATAGELAPGQAGQLVGALVGVSRVVEATELLARIERLEAAAASVKGAA
jgi:hypothetical protein